MTEAARGVAEARDGGKIVGRSHAAYCAALSVIEGGIRFAIPPYGNVGLQSAPRTSSHSGALVYCALLVGILFLIAGVGRAGATETIGPASSIPERAAPAVACPSEDFSVFIHGFAESAAVQRAFTKFPLEYGQVDQDLVGTGKPDFNERTIRSFQEIPLFDKADGKRIFPSAINRKKIKCKSKSRRTEPLRQQRQ
jgi:hypothetical protein